MGKVTSAGCRRSTHSVRMGWEGAVSCGRGGVGWVTPVRLISKLFSLVYCTTGPLTLIAPANMWMKAR